MKLWTCNVHSLECYWFVNFSLLLSLLAHLRSTHIQHLRVSSCFGQTQDDKIAISWFRFFLSSAVKLNYPPSKGIKRLISCCLPTRERLWILSLNSLTRAYFHIPFCSGNGHISAMWGEENSTELPSANIIWEWHKYSRTIPTTNCN